MQCPNKEAEENAPRQHEISDRWNICVLFVLYLLQGIPRGLCIAIPIILQRRGISYADQALYDLVSLPGTFKLLWAPIVDYVYISKFGKRKTWIIPIQFLTGASLLYASYNIEDWLGSEDGSKKPNIVPLAVLFFFCNIFLATHDIATDGWALTMLQRKNIGYQGFCNAAGVRIGILIGFIVFILFNSPDFCNQFLRRVPKPYGILSFEDYMFWWSIFLIVVTILILIFKKDNSLEVVGNTEIEMGLMRSYKYIWDILKIKPFRTFCYIMMICRIHLGPLLSVTSLKLIDAGLTPEKLVLIAIPLVPTQMLLPFCFKHCFVSSGSLNRFTHTLNYMMVVCALFGFLVFITPIVKEQDGGLPAYYYILYFILDGVEIMVLFLMHTSFLAFAASISDPTYGGTYLTLVNTVADFGLKWVSTLSIWLVEYLTILSSCTVPESVLHSMKFKDRQKVCCTILDGYYIEIAFSILVVYVWLRYGGKKLILDLQDVDESVWHIKRKKDATEIELAQGSVNI